MTRERFHAVFLAAIMLLSVVAVGIGGLAGSAAADSSVLTVDADADGEYDSIQAAVNNAESGDTIVVKSGSYSETVRINKSINFEGQGSPVVEAPESVTDVSIPERDGNLSPIVYVNNSDVNINGITIDGRNESFSGTEVGLLYRNGDGTISGNNVKNFMSGGGTTGIAVYANSSVTISDNTVKRYSRLGIGALGDIGPRKDPDVTIEGNNVTNVPKDGSAPNGIEIAWGATGEILNNNVSANVLLNDEEWSSTGIILAATDGVVVEGNSVYDNDIGVGLVGDVFYKSGVNVSSTTIKNNEVYNNTKGVTVGSNTTETDIVDNRVYDNDLGVGIRQSGDLGVPPADTEVNDNKFQDNNIQIKDPAENLDISLAVRSNSYDNVVLVNRAGKSLLNTLWSSVQDGVDNAKTNDTVSVKSGTYDENVIINTANASLAGEDDSVINGRIDIKSDEVTVQDLVVRNGAPSDSNEVEGIFVGNSTSGFEDRDGKVTIQNVTVEDIHPHGTSETVEGIHVKHYDDGENINGVEIVDVTVRNVTGPSDKGANGVKLQAGINNISVTDSTIDDVEGGWAYGVTSTWSSGESGAPADIVTTETTISNISGVGFHVAADDGSNFADPTEITVEKNSFIDNEFDIYNANGSSTLRAPFNYYGDDTDPLVGGNVIYDPFLTVSPDQVDADPLSETTDFGHDLIIPANGKPHSVAFPAPVEGNVSEVFGDFNGTVYAYDGDEWESGEEIADKDVDALDAFVVTVDEDERFLQVKFEYAETDDPIPSMTTTDLEAGWNFVGAPTGNTDSDEAFAGSTAEITTVIDVFAGQNTVSTPYGLDASGEVSNPSRVSPFKGYWVFVTDDGELGATVPVEPTQETEEGALTGN